MNARVLEFRRKPVDNSDFLRRLRAAHGAGHALVRVLRPTTIAGRAYSRDALVEVDRDQARELILAGAAVAAGGVR